MKLIRPNNFPIIEKFAIQEKPYSALMRNVDLERLPFDNIFGEDLRISFPLISVTLHNIIDLLRNGDTKTGKKYEVDIVNGIATEVDSGRKMRAGKVVGKELGQNLLDKWARGMSGQDKSIIISRHPVDIIRMSDHDVWSSCHAPPHKNTTGYNAWQSAINEAQDGGLIAYLVDSKDLKDINLQKNEIFLDDERGIEGIKPKGRVRLNRYNNGTFDLAVPITKIYGQNSEGFLESVRDWAYEAQKDLFEGEEDYPDFMDNFVRRGGQYADITNDGELFNFFLDTNIFDGSVDFTGEGSTTQFEIWQDEVSSINNKFASQLKFTDFYAEVEEELNGYPYLYGSALMNFRFDNVISRNLEERGLSNYDGFNSSWKDLLNYEDFVVSDISYNNYGNELHIRFMLEGLEIENPDGYRERVEDFIEFEKEKYHNLKYKIALDLEEIGVLKPLISNRKSILESLEFNNVFVEEVEEDDLDDETHLVTMNCSVIHTQAMPSGFNFSNFFSPVKQKIESKIKEFTNYDLHVNYNCDIDRSSIRITSKFPMLSSDDDFEYDILEWKKIDNIFPQLSNEISQIFYEESIKALYSVDFWFSQISSDPKNIASIPDNIYSDQEFKRELEDKLFSMFDQLTTYHFYNRPNRFFNDQTIKYPEYLRAFAKWVQVKAQKDDNLFPLRRLLNNLVKRYPETYEYIFNSAPNEESIVQGLDELFTKEGPQVYQAICNVLDNIVNRETYSFYYQKLKDKFLSNLSPEIIDRSRFPGLLLDDNEVLNKVVEYLLASGTHENFYKIYNDINLPFQVQGFARSKHQSEMRMQQEREANGNWYKFHKKSLKNYYECEWESP